MPIATPDWVKDAVFYAIFPDRFARSGRVAKPAYLEDWDAPPTHEGFKGGDLLGIVEHMDYLEDLGVNALYLNPIFQSASNHRYHTHDYYQVDPILGGQRAFAVFLDEAHRRGFRVVLDGVFNHASRGFFQFNHLLELGRASPYRDWFDVHQWPVIAYGDGAPNYAAWWGIPALPKFNVQNRAVREFLWSVGQHWAEQGIDGWRLDVPTEIGDDSFWQEFRRRVKAVNPDCYLVGEIWHEAQHWLMGDQFDAVMNYQFAKACIGFFAGATMDRALTDGKGYAPVEPLDAPEFAAAVLRQMELYDWQVTMALMNVLDSHDTARFLTIARGDKSALRLASLFQATFPGPPSIYYGDEVGLTGGNDPECRKGMPWDEAAWDSKLRDHVKGCLALRRAHPVLRRGTFQVLHAAGQVFVYARRLERETYVVALNAGTSTATPVVPLGHVAAEGSALAPLWGDGQQPRVSGGSVQGMRLAPRAGAVWRVA